MSEVQPAAGVRLGLLRVDRGLPAALPDPDLSPEESARLGRIRAPERAAQYRAGRRLLRLLAARVLGVDARGVILSAEGRPHVLAPAGRPAPFLSLAHSGPWVLGAACAGPCGVDLERRGVRRDWPPLARHLGLPADAGEDAVLDAWTLKEARYKAPELGGSGAALWRLDTPAFAACLLAPSGAALLWEPFEPLPASLQMVPLPVPPA